MNTLHLNVFGITISHENTNNASISSDMGEQDSNIDLAFNAGVKAIESMVLSHFIAGVDVSSPNYLEGIETAFDGLRADSKNTPSTKDAPIEKVTIEKHRTINASADEFITYEASLDDWNEALDINDGDEAGALLQLQSSLKTTRTDIESVINEVHEEFNCEISVSK